MYNKDTRSSAFFPSKKAERYKRKEGIDYGRKLKTQAETAARENPQGKAKENCNYRFVGCDHCRRCGCGDDEPRRTKKPDSGKDNVLISEKPSESGVESETSAANAARQEAIRLAERTAAMYDYDRAIDMLKGIEGYDADQQLQNLTADYAQKKSQLVPSGGYDSGDSHFFSFSDL